MPMLRTRITTYLLLSVTLAFAAGIFLAALLPPVTPIVFLISAGTGLIALILHRRRHQASTLFFLLLLAVSLGRIHGGLALQEPAHHQHIFNLITREQEVVLHATLAEMPVFNLEKTNLLVHAQAMRTQEDATFRPTHGRLLLSIKGTLPGTIHPGDQLLIRAQLARPYRISNPGSFDYQTYLRQDDIWISGRITSPLHIHRLQNQSTLAQTLHSLPEQIRGEIGTVINQNLPQSTAAIYRALLIGDRQQISQRVLDAFKGSGCMHILAISGLHLSILAGVLFLLAHSLLKRSEYLILHYPIRSWAAVLTLPPLIFYCLLAGANIPVLRSLLMVCVFILALCSQHRKSLFTTLALAALIILIWRPDSLFTISFQLSFAAVAAIAAIVPWLNNVLRISRSGDHKPPPGNRVGRWILAALMVSTAATIGTAPLLLSAFNRISLVGPIANLLLEPLLCLWSLPLGFLAILLLPFTPSVSVLLLHAGGWGIDLALKLAHLFNQLPLSSLWLPTPAPILVISYYIVLSSCLYHSPGQRISLRTRLSLLALIIVLFILPPQLIFKQFTKSSQLTFLDVGQGSATLLSLPGNRQFLLDGGGAFSPSFNVGERIIAPFLWQQSIRRLEGIIITHADSDHFNGIPFLLARFRPKTLWINGPAPDNPAYQRLIRQARDQGIDIRIPRPGERLIEAGNAVLTSITNPLSGRDDFATTNSNDRGLILRFQHDRLTCLFPGDITRTVEEQLLLHQKPQLSSTILLAAHHGSATSSSEPFLKAVAPKLIVISASRFKPDHFPSGDLRRLSQTLAIPLQLTSDGGAITIDNELRVSTFNTPAGATILP